MTDRSFRHRVLSNEPLIGTFVNAGSAIATEILTRVGFDWLLLDLEHGSGNEAGLVNQLHAMNGSTVAPIVRIESASRVRATRALDQGAIGVMVPRCESAAEVCEAIRHLRFPPQGVRGVATMTRAGQFGAVPVAEIGRQNETVVGVIQIETQGAMAELDAIAGIDGVDVLFLGPSDLSYALGVPGQLDHPTFLGAVRAISAAARSQGKAAGVLLPNMKLVPSFVEAGYTFVAVGSDSAILLQGGRTLVEGFRAAVGVSSAG